MHRGGWGLETRLQNADTCVSKEPKYRGLDGEATECRLCKHCGCMLNTVTSDYISQVAQRKLTLMQTRNRKLTLCGLRKGGTATYLLRGWSCNAQWGWGWSCNVCPIASGSCVKGSRVQYSRSAHSYNFGSLVMTKMFHNLVPPEVALPSFSQMVGTMSITGNPELTYEGRGKASSHFKHKNRQSLRTRLGSLHFSSGTFFRWVTKHNLMEREKSALNFLHSSASSKVQLFTHLKLSIG